MKTRLLIILFCLTTETLFSQISANRWGLHCQGLGGIVSVVDDPLGSAAGWVAFSNTDILHIEAGLSLALEPTLKTSTQIYALYPIARYNTLGINYQYYGNSAYNEQKATLGYGIRIGRNLSLGVLLHYLHSGTEDPFYTSIDIASFSASGIWLINKKIMIGYHIDNPFDISLTHSPNHILSSHYRLGLNYRLTSSLNSFTEIESISFERTRLHCGLEYQWMRKIFPRIGLATNPIEYSFGLGYKERSFGANLAFTSNQYHGYSSMLSIFHQF